MERATLSGRNADVRSLDTFIPGLDSLLRSQVGVIRVGNNAVYPLLEREWHGNFMLHGSCRGEGERGKSQE